ncbi:MAG TPA: hypothetical protein VN817_03360 [Solirubrobacteraceae bacterium]|nr:hypothetical protein [Solirubrobacteraceae bacterium]
MSTTAGEIASPPAARTGTPAKNDSIVVAGLIAFALVNLALAAMLAFAPHAFFEDIGPYGARNDHYMRDLATFYGASAVAGLIAVRRSSWRTPVLWLLAIQSGLHAVNHLIDIGAAHSSWLGPANFASLAIATAALIWLARESARPTEVQR